ncbi:MAG: S41 family peptidase, partial [Bacteroidota bacterium]
YDLFKSELNKAAQKVKGKVDCFRVLTYYVEFFKDNHSSIHMRSEGVDENNEEEVEKFLASDLFKNRESYAIQESDLKQYPIDDIRGIYRLADAYKIVVIPNKTPFRDYIGVILASKSKLWKRGQVKLEIKKIGENRYQAFSYLRNHSLRFSGRYQLKNGILGASWVKTTKKDARDYSASPNNNFDFKMLNDSTAYLCIPSFSGGYSAKIDSLYQAADAKIRITPYLMIDVRDNGGGSDANVSPLLPYIYTNPIQGDRVELLVTEDNINLWKKWKEEWEADSINYGKDQVKWIRSEVARMEKAKPNTFILRSKARKYKIKDKASLPKAVAVIQNQYCASSCETLLFWARQSDKTILVGENSGGYVGYGENGGVNTPCYNYRLTCTMTRYKEQRKYEADGVPPDYQLQYNRDWLEQTIEIWSKKDK